MTHARNRWRRSALAALATLSIGAGTAAAQSCGGEIDRLARQFDLPPDAPRSGTTEAPGVPSAPSGGAGASTTTERRAQSGGVLSPPDTAAPTAIRPPSSAGDRPPSPPDAATTASGAGGELPAAERQRMAQLLQQAQAAARQGNEQQCLDRLREAQTVPGVPGTK
jgi:hypothetical protein